MDLVYVVNLLGLNTACLFQMCISACQLLCIIACKHLYIYAILCSALIALLLECVSALLHICIVTSRYQVVSGIDNRLIANPETRLLTNAVGPLFQATDSHAEYLTNWDEVPRKLSAASWTEDQANAILDFGGSATNEPNCAVQLAGRNYIRV